MEIVCGFIGKMRISWISNGLYNQWYVLPSMTEKSPKTWRFQWECMGISSNFCWWIFQQAMELITMNLTRRFCYDWIYRTIKYIKIRIIDLDSSVSQTLGIPHFMVIFMWIMIIIPKKHRVCAIFRQTQTGVYPVRMLGDGSWVYHTIITFECIEPRMGSWHINKYYVYKVRLPRQLSWFVTPLGFMAVVTIVGWVYKNFTDKDIWGTTFYQLLRLTSRAFNGRRISLDIFLVKNALQRKIHPFFMGKSTISMAIFKSFLLVYQGVLIQIQANIYLAIPVLPE